ncbi:MAG: ATP-binding protein, partial [Bacteroidota bacterium]
FAILIGCGLLVLVCYVFYNNRLIRRQQKLAQQENLIKQQEIEKLLKDQELSTIRNILDIQEKERVRIAKDLHDRLGSMLSMVKLHFQNTNQKLDELKSANLDAYNKANSLLDEACGEVRKIAHNLSSGILKNFGLVAAIEELKNSLVNTKQYSVEFVTHRINQRFFPELEVAIYRIIQELISNIIKHAEATEISIQLLNKDSELHLEVSDNGLGFSNSKEDYMKGMGLKNIESRLQTFEGKMRIDARPKHGVSVFITIPLN